MPVALFNLGTQEILILAVGGLMCLGMSAGLIVLIVALTREKKGPRND